MRLHRSVLRSCLLLTLLVAACVDGQVRKLCFGMRTGAEGAVWVHRWCLRIVRALGIHIQVEGVIPVASRSGLALVSNHLSYLDILVYSAITPLIMVSKTEVRSWPLIGWITAQAGTIYVERADVKGGQKQTHAEVNAAMEQAFARGLPVLFYPEGTTTNGKAVLPFRRGLFNSLVFGSVPLKASALSYTLGPAELSATIGEHVCYWGDMVFGPHLFGCLGLRGLEAQVRFAANFVEGEDRFTLALNAHEEIVALHLALTTAAATVSGRAYAPDDLDCALERMGHSQPSGT